MSPVAAVAGVAFASAVLIGTAAVAVYAAIFTEQDPKSGDPLGRALRAYGRGVLWAGMFAGGGCVVGLGFAFGWAVARSLATP